MAVASAECSDPFDLSIVIDLSPATITGRCDARSRIRAWIREAASVAPVRCEIVLASADPAPPALEQDERVPIRFVHVEGGNHYGLKNAGANATSGRIVLCTDGDCRPCDGYVATLLRALENPAVSCVAGVSHYDGDSLLTRFNTAHSWGFVHCGQEGLDRHTVLAHNVAFRRGVLERDPFGPFLARVGGDRYLTDAVRRHGHRILLVEGMRIYHEDITYSFAGTLERHLREHLLPMPYGTPGHRFSLAFTFASLCFRPWLRVARVWRARHRLGIRPQHAAIALAMNAGYALFDIGAVMVVLLSPRRRRQWFEFLIGSGATA